MKDSCYIKIKWGFGVQLPLIKGKILGKVTQRLTSDSILRSSISSSSRRQSTVMLGHFVNTGGKLAITPSAPYGREKRVIIYDT